MKSILTRKEIEFYVSFAREKFSAEGGVDPIFFFNLEGKVVPLTVSHVFEQYEKRFVMANLGKYFAEKYNRKIDEAIFIFESWYLDVKDNVVPKIKPSESPDRKEDVMILGRNRSGKYISRIFDIDRIKNELVLNKKMSNTGNFAGLLDYIFDPEMASLKERSLKDHNVN